MDTPDSDTFKLSEENQGDLPENAAKGKPLTPAAIRALREAEARRTDAKQTASEQPKEIDGRDGPEPTRYGDWERKGTAVDF